MKVTKFLSFFVLVGILSLLSGCGSIQLPAPSTSNNQKQQFSSELNKGNSLSYTSMVTADSFLNFTGIASSIGLQMPLELPNSKYDWIVTIEALEDKPFTVAQVNAMTRLLANDSNVYITYIGDTRWKTYQVKKTDELYGKVAIAHKLYSPLQPEGYTQAILEAYKLFIEANLSKLSFKHKKYNYTVTQAVDVSHKIAWFVAKNQQWAVIKLKADGGFSDTDVRRTMESLGLVKGFNAHQFFWRNTDFENADTNYMTVWTPEQSIDNKGAVTELVFGFSIPRSMAPLEIYNAMHNIVLYTQQELGGFVVNKYDEPLNTAKDIVNIKTIVKSLQEEDMQPGTGDALYVFETTYTK
ncbi:LptM family lipoprotein [Neptunitalea lumnitzerae]|nr:hypothetical protein [Neptunitalea sp. Y10]